MKTRLLALAILGALVAAVPASAVEERVVRAAYEIGAAGDVLLSCGEGGDNTGACLELADGDRDATITVTDLSGRDVGARYFWVRYTGTPVSAAGAGAHTYETLASGAFCGSTYGIPRPDGATDLQVWLMGPAGAARSCLDGGPLPATATQGTIEFRFAQDA